ncbi:MAG: NUDIX domain-containing protein [Bacteroidales bacterium]|nr:NUDIX domain-containing protein [Bacteroidales bacterium]MCM1148282.1 NUDIX domain-containing protein [Bacteroidales bacterium]MCM1206486.1 NUDIX domain-containing protein [Bacillota bacterium]MCM1510372.1 NUDIX domain-containing protein [Clostridium sp.]
MKKDNSNELFPVVDETGRVLGAILRGDAHNGSKTLHPVVHLHLFNSKGDLFLQKRPEWKDIQPGKWDTACGGHIDYGETPEEALKREAREELGITDYQPERIDMYVHESDIERELVYVNTAVSDTKVCPDKAELDGGRFWTKEEIIHNLGKEIFTPNFETEYKRYFL